MRKYMDIKIKDIQGEDCIVDKGFLESIESDGVLVSLILSKTEDSGYRVIDGRRRLSAAKAAGLETVPGRIITDEPLNVDLLGVLLNLQRSSNLAYEVKALRNFIQLGYTQDEIADSLHTTKTRLKRHFRLLALCDDAIQALEEGRLKSTAALSLARFPLKEQKEILAGHENGKITLKDVESSWRNFRLDESSLELPDVEIESESEISGALQSAGDLSRDFEILVSKMTSSRPAPTEVLEAADLLRKYLNGVFTGLEMPVKTVA